MEKTRNLTEGKILGSLIGFAVPVFFTLFLQALYGGIFIFAVFGVLLTILIVCGAEVMARLLHAPAAAFSQTVMYIRICGAGALFIVAYNVLGAIFRGIGDSKTPLITVMIACVINIVGDLLLVGVFHMGATGAALATVLAQAVSVAVSLLLIKRKRLPFQFSKRDIRFTKTIVGVELKLGAPVALQELLVGISFLLIQTIVNSFGVVPSAGIGVAEKVCVFIMLVPSAYMQSMSAFVAQNMGANNPHRAKRALGYGIATAFAVGVAMFFLAFFQGDVLSAIFSTDTQVIQAAYSYLKAYAIDCLLTSFLFCFMGYYNGCEKTLFVMVQGIVGAFLVRIPIAYVVSKVPGATLFQIGLATPASSVVQIVLCVIMFLYLEKKGK